MSHIRRQCMVCATVHEADHVGPCDACFAEDWRDWCTFHRTAVLGVCHLCDPDGAAVAAAAGRTTAVAAQTASSTKVTRAPPIPGVMIACPVCARRGTIVPRLAGRRIVCHTCRTPLRVSDDARSVFREGPPAPAATARSAKPPSDDEPPLVVLPPDPVEAKAVELAYMVRQRWRKLEPRMRWTLVSLLLALVSFYLRLGGLTALLAVAIALPLCVRAAKAGRQRVVMVLSAAGVGIGLLSLVRAMMS